MTPLRSTFALLAAAPLALTGAPQFESLVPQETSVFVKIENISRTAEVLEDHPVMTITENEKIRAFFAPLLNKFSAEGDNFGEAFRNETGLTIEEFGSLFSGQIALAIDFDKILAASMEGREPRPDELTMLLLLELTGDRALLDRFLESDAIRGDKDKKVRIVEEAFMDETIHVIEALEQEENPEMEVRPAYALLDDMVLLSFTVPALKELIIKVKEESGSSSGLAASEGIQRLKSESPDADYSMFINSGRILESINRLIIHSMKQAAEQDPESAMMMPDPQILVDTFNLPGLEYFTLAVDVREEDIGIRSFLKADMNRGITSILKAYGAGFPTPRFVPASAVSVDAARFDIDLALSVIERLLAQGAPMIAAAYQGQLMQIQQATGVDLRQALLANLGPDICVFYMDAEGEAPAEADPLTLKMHMVTALGIRDRQSVDQALEALKALSGMGSLFQSRDFLGHQVHTMLNPMTGESGLTYVLMDNWILIGDDAATIQQSLSLASEGGKVFWDSEDFADAQRRLEPKGMGVSYGNLGPFIKFILTVYANVLKENPAFSPEEEPIEFDYSLLEGLSKELKLFSFSSAGREPDGLSGDAIIFSREEEGQ